MGFLEAWGIKLRAAREKKAWKNGGTRRDNSLRELRCKDCNRKMGEFSRRVSGVLCSRCYERKYMSERSE
jgi:hypothetical protein